MYSAHYFRQLDTPHLLQVLQATDPVLESHAEIVLREHLESLQEHVFTEACSDAVNRSLETTRTRYLDSDVFDELIDMAADIRIAIKEQSEGFDPLRAVSDLIQKLKDIQQITFETAEAGRAAIDQALSALPSAY